MNLKQRALSHARSMAMGLYGNRVGSSFLAVASREILLESIRFVLEDINKAIDAEDHITTRETVYKPWYDHYMKPSEGVFSHSRLEQNRALNAFFAPKHNEYDLWQEGIIDIGFNQVHSFEEEFDLDKHIARPFRDLGLVMQGSGKLDDTHMSVMSNWSTLSINGKKDRIGLMVRYEFV